MPFCPICRFEYQEGIKECPDCGAELVEKLEPEEIIDKLKTAYITLSPSTSQMICELLRQQEIPCLASNELGSAILPILGESAEIQILVPEKKLSQAQDLIRTYFEDNPQELELVICSNCRARIEPELKKCPFCGEEFKE